MRLEFLRAQVLKVQFSEFESGTETRRSIVNISSLDLEDSNLPLEPKNKLKISYEEFIEMRNIGYKAQDVRNSDGEIVPAVQLFNPRSLKLEYRIFCRNDQFKDGVDGNPCWQKLDETGKVVEAESIDEQTNEWRRLKSYEVQGLNNQGVVRDEVTLK